MSPAASHLATIFVAATLAQTSVQKAWAQTAWAQTAWVPTARVQEARVEGAPAQEGIGEDDRVGPGPACGARAALFSSEAGIKVWVTRRGALEKDNPLRPLTPDRLVVLQVVVNGRIATAYGPDYDHLRQGGAPQQLERDMSGAVRWETGPDGVPEAIRVVAQDGTVVLGPIRFAECADAPAGKAVVAPVGKPEPKSGRRAAQERRSGEPRGRPDLPQGALPNLSIPQRGVD